MHEVPMTTQEAGQALLYAGAFLFMYCLPTFVAHVRRHQNAWAIMILNILMGWTMIGWVIAMVWASTEVHHRVKITPPLPDPAGGPWSIRS